MNVEQVEHTPRNGFSPLFDGHLTYVPPFWTGVSPDYVKLVGGGSSAIEFDGGILGITDRDGRKDTFNYGLVIPGTAEAMESNPDTAGVVSYQLKIDRCWEGGRIAIHARRYNPGYVDQVEQSIDYTIVVEKGCPLSDREIMDQLAARINRDPNRMIDAEVVMVAAPVASSTTIVSSSTTTVSQIPQINITTRKANQFVETYPSGGRITGPTVITAPERAFLTGPFLGATKTDLTDADFAAGKNYRGIGFTLYEEIPFAGAGLFRQGKSENNSKVFRRARVWVIADSTLADGTTKLNALRTVLTGGSTASKYNARGVIAAFA